jgi:hypothetical protein
MVLVKYMSCREVLNDQNIFTVAFFYVCIAYITVQGISPEDYPIIDNRMEVRMVNHLRGIQCYKGFHGSNC